MHALTYLSEARGVIYIYIYIWESLFAINTGSDVNGKTIWILLHPLLQRSWWGEGILHSPCPFVRPSFHMLVKSTIMTENKPIIGRTQALSSTDWDMLWWHKPYLLFWLWLEKNLVTMDPYCGTLIPSNFLPWSLTHFACGNIDINDAILDCEKISHATSWIDEFETINKP